MRLCCLLALSAFVTLSVASALSAETSVVSSPDEYGQLCRRLNAVTGRSVEQIRSSLGHLAGKYVEIRGKVLGRAHGDLTDDGTVDMYLKCEEDSCFVACPPGIPELRPGRCVRLLMYVPRNAGDIEDCTLKAVMEDTLAYEKEEQPAPPGEDTEKRLEIGEAAMGVRDRVPDMGPAAPVPPLLPQFPQNQPRQGAPGRAGPGAALPAEMRHLSTLSGKTGQRPAMQTRTAPQVRLAAQTGHSYEGTVKTWTGWIRKINASRTVQEADLIARWTIYHCAVNQVDHRLMFAVMRYESDYNPRCVSHAGAMGLTQLMPCNVRDFKVKDPFDIAENIRGGVEHLAEFLRKYQGKSYYEQTVLALACYNAGPGAVAKYGGVPPYKETQDYVRKVPALFAQLVKDGYP